MPEMIDSKQKKLNIGEIFNFDLAANSESENYPPAVLYAAFIKEISIPNTVVRQTGNTIWVVHKGEERLGEFKCINADTKENLDANFKEFIKWSYETLGMDFLVTRFKDESYLQFFRNLKENPPTEEIKCSAQKTDSGFVVVVQLGPKRD